MAKQIQVDEQGNRKFGLLDKLSYAAGDFGCNMSFALAGTWFTMFWTQYMKIDSILFAGILVALKIWDAINDPMVGTYMDTRKKQYKLGKFRHFIQLGSFGLAISACLCFLPVPEASTVIKVILCAVGYIAWDACYTIVNVPYGSMLSVITAKPGERAQLGAWRTLGALAASLPIGIILPIILYDENRNIMGGRLFITALILGIVALAAFQFMIRTTVQRVEVPHAPEKKEKFNFLSFVMDFFSSVIAFFKNRPALGATFQAVGMYVGMYAAANASTVMFQAYFQNTAISGLMSLVTMLPTMLFIPFINKITVKYGKKEASAFGLLFSIVACALMCVVPIPANTTGIAIYMVLQLLNGLGMGISSCVCNAMMADAIDYNEWKNGTRQEGIIYSLHSLFRKVMQGVGPSVGLVLMVMLGYNEQLGANQPFEVALNMRYLVAVLYLVGAVIMWVGVQFVYNLDKKTLAQMNKDLGR